MTTARWLNIALVVAYVVIGLAYCAERDWLRGAYFGSCAVLSACVMAL